jgi:hypothetical protein
MDIKKLKEKHKGEWLAIEVTKLNELNEPVEGKLLLHDGDHDRVWDKLPIDNKDVYITYAGPPLEKGHAAAF